MNERVRVMVQLEDGQKEKIENCIKESFPKLKNTSEVLREALRKFLTQAAINDLLNQDCDMNIGDEGGLR